MEKEEDDGVIDLSTTEQTKRKEQALMDQLRRKETTRRQQEEAQIQYELAYTKDIKKKFQSIYIEYKDTSTEVRPFIHKLSDNSQINITIANINTIIHNKINEDTTMEELQLLIYTGALTTSKIHTRQRKPELTKAQKKPQHQHGNAD